MKKLVILLIILLGFTSCNCRKKIIETVPIETIKTEYITQVEKHTEYVHDSIYIESKNDTVYKYVSKILIKEVLNTDTIIKIDTIPQIVTKKEVVYKNHLYKWQWFLIIIGIGSILIALYKIKKKWF